jgi:hypothetical protein
MRQLSHAR